MPTINIYEMHGLNNSELSFIEFEYLPFVIVNKDANYYAVEILDWLRARANDPSKTQFNGYKMIIDPKTAEIKQCHGLMLTDCDFGNATKVKVDRKEVKIKFHPSLPTGCIEED